MFDVIFSLAMIAYSIFLISESFKLPRGIANIPGPGFFPLMVAFVILILSTILLLKSFLTLKRKMLPNSIQGNWLRITLVIIAILVYTMLWGKGNFTFNTILLLFAIQLSTKTRWYIALISSLTLSVSILFLFGKVFRVILF